jgi:hypothetical protein
MKNLDTWYMFICQGAYYRVGLINIFSPKLERDLLERGLIRKRDLMEDLWYI